MSFVLTDIQRRILETINSFRYRGNRLSTVDGSPIYLSGVPESILRAELHQLDDGIQDQAIWSITLEELATRDLIQNEWSEHTEWRKMEYRCPEGNLIRTDVCKSSGLREVYRNGICVGHEYDGVEDPCSDFAVYCITKSGLEAIEHTEAKTDALLLPTLTEDELSALSVIRKSKTTMFQEDISAATNISRKTVGKILTRLLDLEVIQYPNGEKKGAAITSLGRRVVDS